MFETPERILAVHGEEAKAVVWAHNSPHRGCAPHRDGRRPGRAETSVGSAVIASGASISASPNFRAIEPEGGVAIQNTLMGLGKC